MALKFDSIGLAGAAVGVLNFSDSHIKWLPRHEGDASPKTISLDAVLRASWAPIGKQSHHVRLFCKNGEKLRFDGFRRADISDGLKAYFDSKDVDFDEEKIYSGGGNYGVIDFEDAGSLALTKDGASIFELNLSTVAQCITPGHKHDELDIHLVEKESSNREDQSLYSMRLWIPGQQAAEFQTKVLSKSTTNSSTAEALIQFDREQGTFLAPKNKYSVDMHDGFLRLHGNMYDYRVEYSDISRFYMLEKPQGSGGEAKFFYFVICLEKPVRQGQQKYSYLVWQTHDEDTVITMNMDQEKISEKYPDSGLKQSMESALHKLIGKVFKALTGKVVYAGSRKFKSSEGNQCVSCHFKQHTGVLYPNEKSFVFLHQPTLVIEYSDVDYVEFVKTSETRNFDMCVQLKAGKGPPGEAGKKLKFGAIEKKQFSAIAEFVKDKEAYFSVKSYEPEAADEDFEEDEDDDDFKSGDESAGSGDDDDDDDDEEDGVEDEVESKPLVKAETQKRKVPEGSKAPKSQPKEKEVVSKASPKKKKKDANAPLGARSAYMLWSNATRTDIKAEKPEMTFTEINQELGVKWKELDDASKAAWQTKADEDKRRHASQMEDYVPPEGASDEESGNKSKLKKKRKTKDPNAPKMPQTSFFLFMNQERSKVKAENPTATSGELGKLLGIAWKALTAEEKAPFEDLASKAKEEYKVALANYKGGAAEDDDNAPKKAKIESDDDAEEAEDADEEVGADDDDAEDVE